MRQDMFGRMVPDDAPFPPLCDLPGCGRQLRGPRPFIAFIDRTTGAQTAFTACTDEHMFQIEELIAAGTMSTPKTQPTPQTAVQPTTTQGTPAPDANPATGKRFWKRN